MDGPFFVAYPKLSGHGSHSVFNQTTTGSYKIYEAGPNSTALRLGAGAFTIECWVKPTSHTNWSRIIDFGKLQYEQQKRDKIQKKKQMLHLNSSQKSALLITVFMISMHRLMLKVLKIMKQTTKKLLTFFSLDRKQQE